MELSTTKEEKVKLKRKENFTFSFFIAVWIIVSIPFGGILYYVALYTIPFQNPYYSVIATLFLQFLFVLISQIFAVLFVIGFLPFSPIDFSIKALKRSFFHKMIFIFTFPFLLLEFYMLEKIIRKISAFTQPDVVFLLLLAISIIPITIWLLFTLWIWEVINGKNSSQFLKIIRVRSRDESQDLYQEILDFQQQSPSSQLSYPIRWAVISIVFPFLTSSLSIFSLDRFIRECVSLIGLDLFLFVWIVPIFLQIVAEKGYECKALRILYLKLFGEYDISKNIGLFGTFFIFVIPLIFALFNIDPSFFLSFICMTLIFLGIIFSNQIKQVLGLNIQTKKEDYDEYKPLFKYI